MNAGNVGVTLDGPGVSIEVVADVWLVKKWRNSGVAFDSCQEAKEWVSRHGGKVQYLPVWRNQKREGGAA